MKIKDKKAGLKNRGFTLIEIMVSISIFSVVMLIVIGALLMLNNANKKAQAVRAVVDNLNFAMEDITRNLMTGRDIRCGLYLSSSQLSGTARVCNEDDMKSGISTIAFSGLEGGEGPVGIRRVCYAYSLVRGADGKPGSIYYGSFSSEATQSDCTNYFGQIKMTPLVSPEVDVSGLRFYVFNEDNNGHDQQPVVIVALSGDINVEKYEFKTPFNIQTTVSQR